MAINQQNGKRAVTHYRVLERFERYTYMEFELETGRTHQIRVHMASLGHPLLGDTLYSSGKKSLQASGADAPRHVDRLYPSDHQTVHGSFRSITRIFRENIARFAIISNKSFFFTINIV